MVLFIFLLRIDLIKCRFHHLRPQNLEFPSFWEKVTSLILREFFESRQLVTKNIYLPPWDLFLNSNEENNIIIWHFVRDKCQVPNSDPHGFEYIISNLEFSFFWIMFDDFWWYSMYFSWKYEESKTRNFLRFIFPAEFLEKLGYEFHFDQKTWIHFSKKWTNIREAYRPTLRGCGGASPHHKGGCGGR